MPYLRHAAQQKSLIGFLMLLSYAERHACCHQWIPAIRAILARLEVRHG
jgi:hypothetical protein